MATDIIQVDYQKLGKIASDFSAQNQQIKKILKDATRANDLLRHGAWISDTATQFFRDMDNEVLPAVTRLTQAFEKTEHLTREIARLMRFAEQEAIGKMMISAGLAALGLSGLPTSLSGRSAGAIAAWEAGFDVGWAKGYVKLLGADYDASYNLRLGKDGLTAKGQFEVNAYLLRAHLSAKGAGLEAAADALAGANIKGAGELSFNPFKGTGAAEVKLGAFAGARASANVGGDLFGLGVAKLGGNASVSAGFGANFDANVGFQNGKFKFGFDMGASFILGTRFGFNMELNVGKAVNSVVDAGKDAVNAVGKGVKAVGKVLGSLF